MPRTDKGTKRTKYKINYDKTGKVTRENRLQVGFWKMHTLEDIKKMSTEEFEAALEAFFVRYEALQLKRDRNWWYPEIPVKTINEVRNTKYVDKGFG